MMSKFNIVLFQPPYPSEATTAAAGVCVEWMRTHLAELTPGEQELVLLPEYAATPGLRERNAIRDFAESQGADLIESVRREAIRLACLVIVSGPARHGHHWFNRSLVFDGKGEIVATYDKMHLTDEEQTGMGLTPGAKPVVFEYCGLRMGFAVCFDMYFPEHCGNLGAQHADIVLCPSYQRSESAERIRLLARSRAFDNGFYLLRAAYAMQETGVGGCSLVASPSGTLEADAGESECVLRTVIEPQRKFMKPASYGREHVEHRALIESRRRPSVYRPHFENQRRITDSDFPRLCAHRGISIACPENTLPAFAAAVASGAHEIEFDVWSSRDGVPVVCHDNSVDRTTNGAGKFADLDWATIRGLDAGIRCNDDWSGARIPRLEEALDLAAGRVGLNIHVKCERSGGCTIKRVCDLIMEYGLTDTAYLALGTEQALRIARDYAPDIQRACLVKQTDGARSIAIAKQYACRRIQFFRQVTRNQINEAHDAGIVCNLFWSDDPEDAMQYVRKGIDVILTNRAHRLIAAGFPKLSSCVNAGSRTMSL